MESDLEKQIEKEPTPEIKREQTDEPEVRRGYNNHERDYSDYSRIYQRD